MTSVAEILESDVAKKRRTHVFQPGDQAQISCEEVGSFDWGMGAFVPHGAIVEIKEDLGRSIIFYWPTPARLRTLILNKGFVIPFETSLDSGAKRCDCDRFVLMNRGCQCGGI